MSKEFIVLGDKVSRYMGPVVFNSSDLREGQKQLILLTMWCTDPGIAIADWMIAIQPMEPQFNTTVRTCFSELCYK